MNYLVCITGIISFNRYINIETMKIIFSYDKNEEHYA